VTRRRSDDCPVASTQLFSTVLGSLSTGDLVAFLMHVLYGYSTSDIAARLRRDGRAVDQQIARTYARLNQLLEEELKGRGGTLLVDDGLRRLIRRSTVEFWAPWCEWCDHALPTRVTHVDFQAVLCRDAPLSRPRGRPRRYCSAACRQKAYRWRRAIAEQPVDAE
jgi:thiol-disulfide isomerase/thioredoxin